MATLSDPLQIVLVQACLCGHGACADFPLNSAALVKTEWQGSPWPRVSRCWPRAGGKCTA